MKFEDISSKEDFEEHFFYDKGFDYIDDETFWIDKEHMAKYYFVDNLNYSKAYQLYRKKKGFEMTPYCIFIDNAFDVYYIFSEYHTPFKFVYDKNRRERNYTKQSRLQLLNALNYEDKAYNDSFQALFDTKPLVKKFYDEYKAMKSRLSNSIKGLADGERWFYSQVLFDRIIFIYFLQSRGIIKENFLTNLYKNRDKKRNFFKDYLVPLFFNAFNTQHEIYEKVEVNGIDFGHVPYLNGGLFRKKDVELDNEIQIKDEIWGEIFNHFDSYEWVVEERQKDAVVLTPSILGHIFEQSVTGRKEKGAYYTPSEITDYISMNTIYPYITDRLNERFGTNYRNITSELLRKDDLSENDIDKIAFLYFNILKELRVLDNACGSGAFLMAAHKILLALYRQCYRILKDEMVFSAENMEIEKYGSPDYYFKRVIATNNIYGVDLEEGAVEIAKLRLWLAMISDLSVGNVEPLPNIDYNIMPGNTLIGYVEAPLIEQATLDSSDTTKQIIKAKGVLLSQYKATTDPQVAENLRGDIERINEKFRAELNEKFHRMLTVDYKIDISKEELEALHPFHWGFEFYEVFDPAKPKEERGFDVVIGNPPYGADFTNIEKNLLKKHFLCKRSNNSAEYFFERCFEVISKGYVGYIVPKTIAFYGNWEDIRKYLLSKIITHLFDVGIGFVGVNYEELVIIVKNVDFLDFRNNVVQIHKSQNLKNPIKQKRDYISGYVPQELMIKHNKLIFTPINKVEEEILLHIEKISTKFRDIYSEAFRGLYIPDKEKETLEFGNFNFINKVPDVQRYYFKKIWHINLKNKKYLKKAKKIMVPRLFFKVLRGKKLVAYGDFNGNLLTTEKLVNVVLKNNSEHDLKTLLAIINSTIPSYYIQKMLFSDTTETSRVMDDIYVGEIPVPAYVPKNKVLFIYLVDYLLFLNKTEDRRTSYFSILSFFDTQLLDSLVYTLYFKEKFQEDSVPTNLPELMEPYLVDIEDLESDKEKTEVIESVYERITADREIMECIEKIKGHEWVKVIEEVE